ncbi:MAG: hypothetical protein K2N28_00645 [Muribaculaceae bacterium]|nr:hypothetical protein [Muribaculaceae bacterium]
MRSILVILTLLASIGFYDYKNHLALPVQRAMLMFMVLVCLFVGMCDRQVKLRESRFPRLPWFIFGCSLVVSVFMAVYYHQQSLTASLVAQSTTIFAYMYFFVLILLNPDPKKLIRYLFYMSAMSLVIYFMNLATYPHNIFGTPILTDTTRGMPRVPIPTFNVIMLLVFYSINQWSLTKNKKWWWLIGIGFMMVILSLTRQVMAIMGLLCFLQLLQKMSWVKKFVYGCIILSIGYVVVINLPIYKNLKEISETQIDDSVDGKEDVRIRAWRYYAYEGHENIETLFLGNGTPSVGKSVWGKRFEAYAEESGELIADVSWAGCVFLYGIIGTLALLIIVFCAIFKRKSPDKQYLTYFMICAFLEGIASGVWYYNQEIIVIMMALYLIYRKSDDNSTPFVANNLAGHINQRRFVIE